MARKLSPKTIAKQIDDRINRAYNSRCSNIQINIMDISKIFAVGKAAVEAGADDAALGDAVFNYVQTIRKN